MQLQAVCPPQIVKAYKRPLFKNSKVISPFSNDYVCLFVFKQRPLIGCHYFRWTNGQQLCNRTDIQTVLWDCDAFFSSHQTNVVQCYVAKLVAIAEICVAIIVQWRLMRLGLLTKIDNSTFFRHPIPGVVTSLPLLILIARYM